MEKPPNFEVDLGKVVDRRVVEAAALTLVDAALRLIEGDGHTFGSRPCVTCRTVSSLVGRSFGCIAYAEKKATGR
jgi:hypothetical protein